MNSARMYSGAGPGPMLAAAAAWDGLAADLNSAATSYGAVVSDLSADWHGPSSASMAAAAAPYAEWMSVTAAQAEQVSAQATAAVAAYETAFAATVPPPVIAANRSLLMTLIATNILGLNTPAIAATEAHYAEMWAQDAAAMYSYAGSAAAATRLIPFAAPPENTNRAGMAAQSAAVRATANSTAAHVGQRVSQLSAAMPNAVHSVAPNVAASPLVSDVNSSLGSISTILGTLGGAYSPVGTISNAGTGWLQSMQIVALVQNIPGVLSLLNGPPPITGALGPLSGGYVSWQAPLAGSAGVGAVTASAPAVSAATARASLVGSLSVPTAWAANAPAINLTSTALPGSVSAATTAFTVDSSSGLFNEMALSSLAGRAVGGTTVHAVAGGGARVIGKARDTEPLTTATILVIPVGEE